MKIQETDYLDILFASSSDVTEEVEVEVPLIGVPEGLDEKLYAIVESSAQGTGVAPVAETVVKPRFFQNWSKVSSIAATLAIMFIGFQFYQQQQALRQLEQAQADLATALHYLSEANRITQSQVLNSVNDNIKKAGVEPALEIGRESVIPNLKQYEADIKRRSSSL